MNSTPLTVRKPSWKEEHLALISGIANAGGGTLVVAAPNAKGNSKYKKMQRAFEVIPNLTRQELGLNCTIEPVMDGSELCLEILIPTPTEPISYQGMYYLYANGTNTILDSSSLDKLLNKDDSLTWELTLQPFIRHEDIAEDVIEQIAKSVRAKGEDADESDADDVSRLLSHLNIIDGATQSLTSVGVLMIHRHPERIIAGASVRLGFIDTETFETKACDEVTGPLSWQLSKALALIFDTYLPMASRARTDETMVEPPRAAVEEALLNALVHKDYASGVPIKVSISRDRLTIDNVGRPPETWSCDDLLGHHNSRPNNPFLASALHACDMFIGWGGGIRKIREACDKSGLDAVVFELRTDETTVSIPLAPPPKTAEAPASSDAERDGMKKAGVGDATASGTASSTDTMGTMAGASTPVAAQARPEGAGGGSSAGAAAPVAATQPEQGQASAPTHPRHVSQFAKRSIAAAKNIDLTNTDEYILKVLNANGRATAPRIGDLLGVSESTVRRSFKKLRNLGLIERVGSDKAGYWKVTL